jgi:alkanesulfonate monooxygenase SsuD/methylene tetrahydromethanopterin reductase-like flavin-dependent oxidoreductase (luciferase family)
MAESFQRLSAGRLILGLGAGSGDQEFRAYGLPVLSPQAKLDGLEQAVQVVRGMWSEPTLTYCGSIHQTVEAALEPKPERPIPIWLGTFGPRGLALTGRVADGWIPSLGYRPDDELPHMLTAVLDSARAAGRNTDDITCALNVRVSIGSRDGSYPDVVAGSADQITERLLAFTTIGFNAFNLIVPTVDRATQVEHLAAEVVPLVRAQA